jgi:hypothetical protein
MKILTVIVLFSALLLLGPTAGRAAKWVFYGTDPLGNRLYYDEENKTYILNDIAKGSAKTEYTEEGRADYIEITAKLGLSTEGYDKVSNSVSLLYINCNTGEYKFSGVTDYDTDGKVLASGSSEDVPWKPIGPDSPASDLHKAVCTGKSKK